jgi:hypothetical protein
VDEEVLYEFLALFTSLRSPFLKGWPGQLLASTSMNSGARPTTHDLPPTIE